MNREEIIDKVCTDNGLTRLLIGTKATWLDKDNQYGIEIITGKPEPFKVEGISRSYSMTSDVTEKVMKAIEAELKVSNGNARESKIEQNEPEIIKTGIVNNLSNVFEGKRILVPQDLEELKRMSTFDRMLLFQRTDSRFVKYLDKKKERPYVEGNIMKMEANIAFLFKISTKINGFPYVGSDAVACHGSMKVEIDGIPTIVSAVGIDIQVYKDGDKTKPVLTIPEMIKNAVTDMKKKCLADMGFNGDVYRGEV